jgi:hypothetical protein
MLALLAIMFIAVAGWGFFAVRDEVVKNLPPELREAPLSHWAVDPFVWSSRAPRALRRRYVLTQACLVPAFACLAGLVWPQAPYGAAAFLVLTLFAGATLAWKCARHGC